MDGSTLMTCSRCGGAIHLIEDDGPTVCRTCVLAWGQFGAAIVSGRSAHEPSRFEVAHLDHVVPELGCLLCAFTRRSVQWPERGRS